MTQEMINENKAVFIDILTEALNNRGESEENIDDIINALDTSDFFVAPASTKYHNCTEGGLCDHSLNVYYNMMSLAKNKHLLITKDESGNIIDGSISADSIAVVALLHDISKINTYRKAYKNTKVYSENGTKYDNGGKYDWITVESWEKIPLSESFLYSNHETTSEYMIRQFISLSREESIAILHHHGGLGVDTYKEGYNHSIIFTTFNIAVLLHVADMISTFVDEKPNE